MILMPIIITKGHRHHTKQTTLKKALARALFIVVDYWSIDYWCKVVVVVVVCR